MVTSNKSRNFKGKSHLRSFARKQQTATAAAATTTTTKSLSSSSLSSSPSLPSLPSLSSSSSSSSTSLSAEQSFAHKSQKRIRRPMTAAGPGHDHAPTNTSASVSASATVIAPSTASAPAPTPPNTDYDGHFSNNNFTHNFFDLQNLIDINDFLSIANANDSDAVSLNASNNINYNSDDNNNININSNNNNNINVFAVDSSESSIIKLSNSVIMNTLLDTVLSTASTATISPETMPTATTITTITSAPTTPTSALAAAAFTALTATVRSTTITLSNASSSSPLAVTAAAAVGSAEPTSFYANLLLDMSPATTSIAASAAAYNENIKGNASDSYWELADRGVDFDSLYRHSLSMSIVYCVAYIIVFLVGLIGNSFVIAVVLRAPRMRTVTNYFIVNLAIADILVIVFCLPATLISNIFVPWMLGWLMCKFVPYIQGVSVAASVYSLIAVSLDRFIAIWWPLKQMTKRRARFMILCIWVIALCSTIPWLLFFDLVPAEEVFPDAIVSEYTQPQFLCQEVWPPGTNGNLYFLLAHLVACYLLPMSLITLCYVLIWIKVSTRSIPGDSKDAQMDRMQQKSKVKVIKMLVAVVILFVLSWLPLYVIFARIKFGADISAEEFEILKKVTPFAQWLGSSNSCINPILYAFFNKKYRRGFAAIVKSRSCCGRLRYYDNVAIASSTTSTRKSSHYHHTSSRKSPSSPGLRKTNAVSYIYEHNTLRRHNVMMKQDSNLSQQMLLKQDSHGSRQFLIKQESASSEASGSRRLLCQQDSNGSKMSLSKQDSIVSYMEAKQRVGHAPLGGNSLQEHSVDSAVTQQDTISIDSRRGTILKQDSLNTPLEHKRQKFVKQDSVISFVDQRPEPRRHQLVKQDSVISFADQRRGLLNKQDSIIANRNGDGHTVSILKKTDSQHSNGFATPSPRKNIEICE